MPDFTAEEIAILKKVAALSNEELSLLQKVAAENKEWFDWSNYFNPTGSILAFGGLIEKRDTPLPSPTLNDPDYSGVPKGWLLCDGGKILDDSPQYNKLALILADHWGQAPFNEFALPDLRGQFLRGVTEDMNLDPDISTRFIYDEAGNPVKSAGVGSLQSWATSRPVKDFEVSEPNPNHIVMKGYRTWDESPYNGGRGKVEPRDYQVNMSHRHEINGGGDKETRPINAYVNFIIKL